MKQVSFEVQAKYTESGSTYNMFGQGIPKSMVKTVKTVVEVSSTTGL